MKQEMMTIISQIKIAPKIFELILKGKLVKEMKTPGQFLHIKVPQADLLLRRPISLASIDQKKETCTVIYRVEGVGTESLSLLKKNDFLDVMGPLGNGFDTAFVKPNDRVFIIGGGIGVPPLYQLSKELKQRQAKVVHLLGFAKKEVIFYEEEFRALGETYYSTDDGSYGILGHAGNLLVKARKVGEPSAVYACGSNGLLKMVEQNFSTHPHAYLSLEARMACGMGACYACVCHLQKDETGTKSKKICDEGPVFPTGEVIL